MLVNRIALKYYAQIFAQFELREVIARYLLVGCWRVRTYIYMVLMVQIYKNNAIDIRDVTLLSEDGALPVGHRVILTLVSSFFGNSFY